MPAHKRQHYLPSVYLKNFSTHGRNANRKSRIFRFDGDRSLETSVESQCAEKNFYSTKDATAVEQMFQGLEGIYGRIIKKVWDETTKQSDQEYFGLILLMVDFHIRNIGYQNSTGEERIVAYHRMFQLWIENFVSNPKDCERDDIFWLGKLKETWRVAVFHVPARESFLTSDNPSLWAGANGVHSLIFLPLTPYHLAVAYNSNLHQVGGRLTIDDLSQLNTLQVGSAFRSVYSHDILSPESQELIAKKLKNRQLKLGAITPEKWLPNLTRLSRPLSIITSI